MTILMLAGHYRPAFPPPSGPPGGDLFLKILVGFGVGALLARLFMA